MSVIVDEVMLREPNLLIPGKKPVGPVKIDWNNDISNRLTGCWLFRDTFRDETSGKEMVDYPSCSFTLPKFVTTLKQRCIHIDEYTVIPSIELSKIITDADNWTALLIANPQEKAGLSNMISMAGTSTTNENFLFAYWGSDGKLDVKIHNELTGNVTDDVTGDWHTFIFSVENGVNASVYYDGKKVLTDVVTQRSIGNTRLSLGTYPTDYSTCSTVYYQTDLYVSSLIFWNRGLSDSEASSLSNNPYQFLIPS